MSRGLIAILVIGGAGAIAFFMFGSKARAAGNGSNVEFTEGWNDAANVGGLYPNKAAADKASKLQAGSPVSPVTGWNDAANVGRVFGSGEDARKAACAAAAAGVPGATCLPGPTGVSNPTYIVQPHSTEMYKGQFGADIEVFNKTRTGSGAF